MAQISVDGCRSFPDELVGHVRAQALFDADLVHAFLAKLEIDYSAEKPIQFPAAFLLGAGAALKLAYWEQRGYYPHKEVGLPDGKQAMLDVLKWCHECLPEDRDERVIALSVRVTELTATRFSWESSTRLGIEILIGNPNEESLLDAVAAFIWSHRNSGESDART